MIRVVVAFCRERFEHDTFRENGMRGMDARVSLTMRQTAFMAAVTLITTLGTAAAIAYGAYLVVEGRNTVGYLYVVLNYMGRVYQPLESLSHQIGAVQVEFINLRATFKILDAPAGVEDRPGAIRAPTGAGRGGVRRRDLPVPQRTHGVVGGELPGPAGRDGGHRGTHGRRQDHPGRLISRLVDPDRACGDRRSRPGRRAGPFRARADRRGELEPLLFARPIIENIQYGREGRPPTRRCRQRIDANAHDFIMGCPRSTGRCWGPRRGISGGERQRITIARAFLRDAPILILDEPTAAIDSRTEQVILDSLDRLAAGRTTFMIAHRLSTVTHADRILVLDHGRVCRAGPSRGAAAPRRSCTPRCGGHRPASAVRAGPPPIRFPRRPQRCRPRRRSLRCRHRPTGSVTAVPPAAAAVPVGEVPVPAVASVPSSSEGMQLLWDSGAIRGLLEGPR